MSDHDPVHTTTFSPMGTSRRPSRLSSPADALTGPSSHRTGAAVPSSSAATATATATAATTSTATGGMTLRARRRREEAVRRLVADVQAPFLAASPPPLVDPATSITSGVASSTAPTLPPSSTAATASTSATTAAAALADAETHQWLVASTVAAALEKGLDRDLHAELVQESKDNAGRIGQICHDHADVFLASVAKVVALGDPCADLADALKDALPELHRKTAGPLRDAATEWERACLSYARARTLHVLVQACQAVAYHLERARKQAHLGRPRAALDAADKARQALATPVEALFREAKIDPGLFKVAAGTAAAPTAVSLAGTSNASSGVASSTAGMPTSSLSMGLEQTPFGKRALTLLPKIESEVLMNARRGLNRWFLALRSGGDHAHLGRRVLRQCAHAVATGTGQLGLGGHVPPAYVWRAKTADNLLSRLPQTGKVARAVRQGYWFDRDAPRDAERLDRLGPAGIERRAESIAAAFGWQRCWDETAALGVDPAEFGFDGDASMRMGGGLSGSRHGGGLSGSRHGLTGSRHGSGGLRGSRHGRKTLGFRATTSSRSQAFQDITSTLGTSAAVKTAGQGSKWAELLLPALLMEASGNRYADRQ